MSQVTTGGTTENEEMKKVGALQRSEGMGGINESDLEALEDEHETWR